MMRFTFVLVVVVLASGSCWGQIKDPSFKMAQQSMRLAISLQKNLDLNEDKKCAIQLVIYDEMYHYSTLLSEKKNENLKLFQEKTLEKVESLLTEEQKAKFKPIKEFYLTADLKQQKRQRAINNASKNYEKGKIFDAAHFLKQSITPNLDTI